MEKNLLRIGAQISIALSALVLALNYLQSFWALGVPVVAGLALIWLASQARSRASASSLASFGFAGMLGLAAFGVWQNMPPGWMLLAAAGALVGWDLNQFESRLRSAKRTDNEAALIQAHVRRLLIVAATGLALSEIALGVQVEFSFGWTLLLGLLAMLGLSRAIGFLRRESD
jgi:hypothetical protein